MISCREQSSVWRGLQLLFLKRGCRWSLKNKIKNKIKKETRERGEKGGVKVSTSMGESFFFFCLEKGKNKRRLNSRHCLLGDLGTLFERIDIKKQLGGQYFFVPSFFFSFFPFSLLFCP